MDDGYKDEFSDIVRKDIDDFNKDTPWQFEKDTIYQILDRHGIFKDLFPAEVIVSIQLNSGQFLGITNYDIHKKVGNSNLICISGWGVAFSPKEILF